MEPADTGRTVPDRYRHFATSEAVGDPGSPVLARMALAVAEDQRVLALLAPLTPEQQRPNLLFAALRWHGVDLRDPHAALDWAADHADDVLAVLTTRRTQTNEAARCALLLPFLARAAQGRPVALLELGASAGLCLLPDRFSYAYATPTGPVTIGSGPVLDCATDGVVPLPTAVPEIVWRAGVDLEPLDPADPDTRRWLQALVWPEHADRAARLDTALDVAAADPPRVVRADFLSGLRQLLPEVPREAVLVVTHTAALVYAPAEVRREVRAVCAAAGAVRLGAEGQWVLDGLSGAPETDSAGGGFVISVDDDAVALGSPHGRWLRAL